MEDRKVVKQVMDGDEDAYRWLVEKYQAGLINHLYTMLGEQELAEDIAQDAFIRAYNKLDKYNPQYAFSTWLYKIATNLAYSQLRKKTTLPLFDEDMHRSDQNVHEESEKSELRENVREVVKKLPAHYRTVVSMYYWQGMSYEEMAAASNVPVGTIKTWMFRAKAKLKEELDNEIKEG